MKTIELDMDLNLPCCGSLLRTEIKDFYCGMRNEVGGWRNEVRGGRKEEEVIRYTLYVIRYTFYVWADRRP